nr:hypothetical protein [Tanacetum cinerariifolium]
MGVRDFASWVKGHRHMGMLGEGVGKRWVRVWGFNRNSPWGFRLITPVLSIIELECSSSPIFTRSDICPIGHMISPLKPTMGTVAGTIYLLISGWGLLNGGNEISGSGEKLCEILCLATLFHGWTIRIAMALSFPEDVVMQTLNELGICDPVHESEDSHAFRGSLNVPTLDFESLHKVLCGLSFSLLDVVNFHRILDALLLLKCPLYYLHFLRAAPFFVNGNFGEVDLSCCILEKTLVGSGLLDVLRERLANDNVCRITLEELRHMHAYLCFLRFATSSSPLCFTRRTWVGEIELRWSTHGEYFMKRSCVMGPTDGANLLIQNM